MRQIKTTSGPVIHMVLLIVLAGCATQDELTVGPPLPLNTEALRAPLAEDSVYLFADRDFQGDTTRLDHLTATPPATAYSLDNRHGISSVRWKLAPGMLLVLYEGPGGRGNQLSLWGQGQASSLSQWQANDMISQWAWYNLAGPPGAASRPLGAAQTGVMAQATLELYRDRDLQGTLTSIGPVTQFPAGVLHKTGAAADEMTSLRWNLPPGVVVVLYEDAEGRGRQLTLFGRGQYPSVSLWDFNDKVSRWAWYDLGAGQ